MTKHVRIENSPEYFIALCFAAGATSGWTPESVAAYKTWYTRQQHSRLLAYIAARPTLQHAVMECAGLLALLGVGMITTAFYGSTLGLTSLANNETWLLYGGSVLFLTGIVIRFGWFREMWQNVSLDDYPYRVTGNPVPAKGRHIVEKLCELEPKAEFEVSYFDTDPVLSACFKIDGGQEFKWPLYVWDEGKEVLPPSQ